jgi:hypothetical protein
VPILTNAEGTNGGNARLEQILEVRRLLHDLSNVLTGLLITAGLLRNFVPLAGNGGRYASDLEGSAERAAELVGEVRGKIHRLQVLNGPAAGASTTVCDVRPSLGQKSGED